MDNLLEQINCPDDLKKLTVPQLPALADQIRQYILSSLCKTGGHLASNLGVVELTVALHYVFDFKTDKLLWDVGHQCYTHKILTGRREKFLKIRQRNGISGFPNPNESPCDQFRVGHAGTSVATAAGFALGLQKLNKEEKVVAVVGDASIVNGLSFEALNNLGLVKRQLLIVLNDNSMAIDLTQGALAKYFARIRLSQTYEDLRKTTTNILEHTPVIGKSVEEIIEKMKKTIRMALPASQMFESLNIPYFGPVDGHDIASLIKLFKALSQLKHPAILHVYTRKGKGFAPAEEDKPRFHSTGPFKMNGDNAESDSNPPKRSFTDVFGEHIVSLAQKNNRIVAITAAMCDGVGLSEFSKKFPDRFYDVGIAESFAVDLAAGLAKSGLIPVVCIYSTFLQRCFDQIFQEVALQNLPVIFCIDRAGLVGADGSTHHGLMDIGFLRMMPNMTLTAPADETELKLALDFAADSHRCVCIRYPRDTVPTADFNTSALNQPFELGKSVTVLKSQTSKAAIVSYGPLLYESLKAAQLLKNDGIDVDCINARFAAPLDEIAFGQLLSRQAEKVIITLEDHYISGGFGSALAELAAAKFPDATGKIRLLGVTNAIFPPLADGGRAAQLADAGIDAAGIAQAVRQAVAKKHNKTAEKQLYR
jgi:1-deoxy-D-xylulose-5-phosphate synthase